MKIKDLSNVLDEFGIDFGLQVVSTPKKYEFCLFFGKKSLYFVSELK